MAGGQDLDTPISSKQFRQENRIISDPVSRVEKAEKVLNVLRIYCDRDLSKLICADFGAGSGIVAARLSNGFARVLAIDLDSAGLALGRAECPRPNVTSIVADVTCAPLVEASCDVVVCNHVYEHVDSAERLVSEIERVLAPNGVCYFSGPNRLRFFEPHLRVWLVHWLPRPILNGFLRVLGRPEYKEHLRTWWSIHRLLRGFQVYDLNVDLVRRSKQFHTQSEPGMAVARLLPPFVLRSLLPVFAPSFNLLIRPNGAGKLH